MRAEMHGTVFALAFVIALVSTTRALAQPTAAPEGAAPPPAEPAPAPTPAPTPAPAPAPPAQPQPAPGAQPAQYPPAQPAATYPPPPPGYGYPPPMYGPPPPPPPPPDPGARLHDGFFLRLGLGLGFGNVSVDSEDPDGVQHEGEIRGMGFGLEVLLGGTPASGLVLGGGFLGHSIPEPTFEIDGVEYDDYGIDFNLFVFPIFLSYYPDPRTGLNLQAMGGIAASYFSWDDPYTDETDSSDTAWGGAVAAGIGYEGWVSSKWSLGGAFRLMYASTSMKDGDSFLGTWDYSYSQVFGTLSFVATMH